jgi:hypothetical protein
MLLRPSVSVFLCLVAALKLAAAPAILFPLEQTPLTGTRVITNTASTNTTFWGTLAGSGALPTLTNGASVNSGKAWQFNAGYYLTVGPNPVTQSLGDITNTTGLSVAFWIKYTNSSTFVRVCGLGGNGETFDFSTQSGGKILFTVGYQPNNTRWVSMTPNNVVFDNNWHHIVGAVDFRRNVNNAVMFIDGVPVLTNSVTIYNSITNTGSLNIGARGNGSATACAMDQFMVFTNALQAAEVSQIYNLGNATNYAPLIAVSAAQNSLVWTNGATNATTTLSAAITDDGLPNPPGRVTNLWTQTSGPTNSFANFSSLTNAATTATFTNTGVYNLRCTTSDGLFSNYDEVTITVFSNSAPVVAAWPSQVTLLSTNPTTISLAGWVLDDGIPNPPGITTTLWTRVSSPGNVAVNFASPTNINTTVTIPTNVGTYVLRVTASDLLLVGSADVTINVVTNLAPVVSAWAAQPILQWPSNTLNLQANVTDDGRPNPPGVVTSLWSKVSGPGLVTFSNAATMNTTATFSAPGIYQLQLVASDSAIFVTNAVWVNLWSNSIGATPPPSVRPLSATPPPYEHPRIFFTDADRPDLQARATNDPVVQAAIYGAGGLSNIVATTIDSPATPVGTAYARLAVGDASTDIQSLVQSADAANTFLTGNGGLYEPLADACYLAWLYPTNTTRLQQLATAVATAALCHSNWYVNLPSTSKGELSPDVYASLGLCYDLMYDWMSDSQRNSTRAVISLMTTNRRTIGWNEADYSDSTNWRAHHDHLISMQLAIEGETGFDAVSLATNAASLKTFTTRWGITENGFSREGTDYFSFGMRNAAPAAIALARRGENLFVTGRIYNGIQEAFYQLAPWGVTQFGHHDGAGWGNDTTGIGIYFRAMKYMFTNDALPDFVLRNFEASPAADKTPLATAMFGVSYTGNSSNFINTATAKNLLLTKFDAQRGLGVARSDWNTNAAQLEFDCRFDTMTLGHLHTDRNNFVFFSHGRTWVGDPGYHAEENDAHSTIFIDGVGQAGVSTPYHWPSMPGHFLEFRDQPAAALFSGDAKPAYDYFWDWATLGSGSGYQPYTSYLGIGKGVTTPLRWTDMMYSPPTDLTGANAWMTNYIRATNFFNPVQRAFRTTLFQRGTNPYAIVVDDIQKDGSPHTYDWSANTIGVDPNSSFADPVTDVSFVSAPDATNAVLYHAADTNGYQPRLLVRVLDAKGTSLPVQIVDEVNSQGTHLRRLVVSRSNTVAPDFKILLFPHLVGEALPVTTWSNNILTVQTANGQLDRIYFNTNADGRTRIQTFRIAGQNPVAAIPSLTATGGVAQVRLSWTASSGATVYVLKVSTNNGVVYSLLASNVVATSFTHTNLLPGTNYTYVVAALNTNGVSEDSASVTVTPLAVVTSPPIFTGIQISGGNLIVTGTNGTAGTYYSVLTTTNLALPLTNWIVMATNQFGSGGAVNFTNPLNPNAPATFFRLRAP